MSRRRNLPCLLAATLGSTANRPLPGLTRSAACRKMAVTWPSATGLWKNTSGYSRTNLKCNAVAKGGAHERAMEGVKWLEMGLTKATYEYIDEKQDTCDLNDE